MMAHVIRDGRRAVAARVTAAALALCAAVVLAGCSVLSGRNVGPSVSAPPSRSGASGPPPHGRAGFTNDKIVSAVLSDARGDFETVETFDYRHLSKYRHAGLAVTTSPYSDKYVRLFSSKTEDGLRRTQTVQAATVDLVGIADLYGRGKKAVALAHAKLTVSSTQSAAPQVTTITAVLQLRKIGAKWRISDFSTGADTHGTVPANADLHAAMAAARNELKKAFGLRRSHFDADFAAALKHTTGDLHAQLEQQKDKLEQKQQDGQYDLTSKVTGFAAVQADGTHAEFVIAVDEYHLGRQGAKFGPYHVTLDVTMTNPHGTWLMSEAKTVA